MARPATAAVRLLTGEREPCRLATTANIDVDAGGLLVIDGVQTVVGDRVLVKNQTDGSENGIRTVSEGQWFRAADARTARTMQKGTTVHVAEGSTNAGKTYVFNTLNPVVGDTPISIDFYISDTAVTDAQAAATAAASSASAAAGSASAASTSATNAATSATNAGNSATSASGSATSASTSAANAGNSATAAAGSASSASTSATNAGNSATSAAASAAAAASVGGFVGSFAKTPAADGVTDDVAALVALEATAQEVIRLKNATYYIGSDYTPTKVLRFSSGSKFLIADGKTVSFATMQPEIHAPKKQRFYFAGTGTGAVTGLDEAHAGWFAGDKLNVSGGDATPDLQKWADSMVYGGRMKFTLGFFTVSGASPILCTVGQHIIGQQREVCRLRFSGAATYGFRFTGYSSPKIENVGFFRAIPLVAPVGGVAVSFEANNAQAKSLYASGCYGVIEIKATQSQVENLIAADTGGSAISVVNVNEAQVNDCIIAASSSWITLSGITGTFIDGEAFTYHGSPGNGIFTDGTNYKAIFIADAPVVGDTIVGTTSGATATLASITNPHAIGAVRLYNHCHASLFTNCEVSGGNYPLLIDADSTDNAHSALSSVFTNCLFDSAKVTAARISRARATRFNGCWFSSYVAADYDVRITNGADMTMFVNCQHTYTGNIGISTAGTATNTQIIGGLMADVNVGNTANQPAIDFENGSSGYVTGIKIGQAYGYGTGHPQIGIRIGVGAVVRVDNIDASLCPVPIQDNSGGTAIVINSNGRGTATNDNAPAGVVGEYVSAATPNAAAAVTMTIASPCVVTWASNPYVGAARTGANWTVPIVFTTTGALPTGLTASTTYWIIGSSVSGNTFQVATSAANALAGTAINTTGSQSGTHTGSSAPALSSATATVLLAISLPAGDWDVDSLIQFKGGATTTLAYLISSLSLSTGLDHTVGRSASNQYNSETAFNNIPTGFLGVPTATIRFSLSATTTIYAVVQAGFAVSTCSAFGILRARRAR